MDGRLTAKLTAGIFVRCETTFKEEKNIVKFQTLKNVFPGLKQLLERRYFVVIFYLGDAVVK
jgi:hypothetical protein